MKLQPTWPVVALVAIIALFLGALAWKGIIPGSAIVGFLGGSLFPTFNVFRGPSALPADPATKDGGAS